MAPQNTPRRSAEDADKQINDVIEKVCAVDVIKRVRLGSLEPVAITKDFVKKKYNM